MRHTGSCIEIDVSYQLAGYRQLLHDIIAMDMATGDVQTNPASPWNWPIVQEQRQQFEQLLTSMPVVVLEPAR